MLTGHQINVRSVAFSPDGQWLASASGDKTVRLWHLKKKALLRLACRTVGRNFTLNEWQQYFSGEPYRKTCGNRPLDRHFLKAIEEKLIKDGDMKSALASLSTALKADGVSEATVQSEARHLAAAALVKEGKRLAKEGKIKAALKAFGKAQVYDPNYKIPAESWNGLCWQGSVWGFATEVMEACKNAVELAPDDGNKRDSRGLARALTGDFPGAIEDFQYYIQWANQENRSKELIPQRQIALTTSDPVTP